MSTAVQNTLAGLTREEMAAAFASTVDGLRASSLAPVLATADMPNKLSFRAGLVVAEVMR